MSAPQTKVLPHNSEFGSWTIVRREPPSVLRPYVAGYSGYLEQERRFGQHLQTPSTRIPLIINLGPSYRISNPASGDRTIDSFTAGLHDGPVLVGSDGPQHCIQVDLTPLGARRIFNSPMHEISNRIVGLDDVLGRQARLLIEQLYETANWEDRFAHLDAVLTSRLGRAVEPPPGVTAAWEQLQSSGGRARIGGVARDLDWSHRHLISQFREHIGLPPKKLARILRFERAVRSIQGSHSVCLATLAQTTGYFDQAHLNRDFREFAGRTPAEMLRRRLPGIEGLVGD